MTQILHWILFVPGWIMLFPLKKERVRHFLSVGFLTVILTTILWQMNEVYKWWFVETNLFFMHDISPFVYGFLPVTSIYAFYFTYPKPWLFFGANIALDAIQAFVISPLVFERFNFYELTISHYGLFMVVFCLAPILYIFQRLLDRNSEYGRDIKAGLH